MLQAKFVVLAVIVAAVGALAFLGSTDSGDAHVPHDHDLAIRKITGDTTVGGGSECVVAAPGGCGYNIILRNNGSLNEDGQVGVWATEIGGCGTAIVDLHGGSASPVAVSGQGTSLLTVDITLPARSQRTVNVGVTYPNCTTTPSSPIDYQVSFDVCHSDDAAGLFALGACGSSDDSGTDPHPLNDAPITRDINQVP